MDTLVQLEVRVRVPVLQRMRYTSYLYATLGDATSPAGSKNTRCIDAGDVVLSLCRRYIYEFVITSTGCGWGVLFEHSKGEHMSETVEDITGRPCPRCNGLVKVSDLKIGLLCKDDRVILQCVTCSWTRVLPLEKVRSDAKR